MGMWMDWNGFNNAASQAILDRDLLEDLLARLGCDHLKESRSGQSYRGSCPVHHGDSDGFVIKLDGDFIPIRWACNSQHCERKFKPSLLGLVWGLLSADRGEDVPVQEAVDWLKTYLGGGPLLPTRSRPRPPKPQPKLLSLRRDQVRQALVIPSPYFTNRGFCPAVLDRKDVGHSAKQRKSIVPLYDDAGMTCVGFMARSEYPACEQCCKHHRKDATCGKGEPKWTTMAGFPKGSCVYNLAHALHTDSRAVIVTEGPGDVWKVEEAGGVAVAVLGVDLTGEQVKKLRALGRPLLLAFDNDKAGRRGMMSAEDLLMTKRIPADHHLVPNQYHDLGSMPTEAVIQWLGPSLTGRAR